MIKYVPFMKAKQNELKSLSELSQPVLKSICPFFDFPNKKGGYEKSKFIDTAERISSRLQKNVPKGSEFYFDNFDLDENLVVDSKHNYHHILRLIPDMHVIPVVGLDRSIKHKQSIVNLKQSGAIKSNTIAFRVCPEDFELFDSVAADIENDIAPIFALFDKVDLILDCRVCVNLKTSDIGPQIQQFSEDFCAEYDVRRVVVTGSSIPASIAEILKVESEKIIPRHELEIFSAIKATHRHAPLVFGDYTTVSPYYSDVDMPPEFLQNIMTAKLAYTVNGGHYFIRGGGMKANGPRQYFGMAKRLCSQTFFRGKTYSSGDAYLEEKSRAQGKNCSPNSVIKPAVVAHISYMALSGVI